jgi:hypothetical protein
VLSFVLPVASWFNDNYDLVHFLWVRRSVFIQSANRLWEAKTYSAIVVIGGVDVVSILRVILHLPCAPHLNRGRPR